jgi:flagellar hook-associated protein 2
MATSAVSTTTISTAADIAKSNKANAQKIMNTLGAGSGVDVTSLAQNLVDAERVPKENMINAKIAKSEAKVTGYGAVTFMLGEVKKAFSALNDKTDFTGVTATSDNTSAFTVSAGATATEGIHEMTVTALAKAQRSVSSTYTSATSSINAGQAMSLSLTYKGTASTINVTAGSDTPQGVVDAINIANKGVKAQLVYTSSADASPYKILLTSSTGEDNSFTLTDSDSNLSFSDIQTAQDAAFTIDGISYKRSSNTVTDALQGVSISMRSLATTSIQLSRETTSTAEKIQNLVLAYNDTQSLLKEMGDSKSTLETYGATLPNDSLLRAIKTTLRSMFMDNSNSTSGGISSLRDVGVSIDQSGVMALDTSILDTKLKTNFDDVVTMFSGNRNNTSEYSVEKISIANDAFGKLSKMLRSTGDLAYQTRNTNTEITRYKADLVKLNTRMDTLLQRYTKQFAIMDSMVGQNNSTKSSLKSTFDGMMAQYK